MRFAILTDAGATPIVSAELASRVKERLRSKVRILATRGDCERAIDEAFAEEERAVRLATYALGPEHH